MSLKASERISFRQMRQKLELFGNKTQQLYALRMKATKAVPKGEHGGGPGVFCVAASGTGCRESVTKSQDYQGSWMKNMLPVLESLVSATGHGFSK